MKRQYGLRFTELRRQIDSKDGALKAVLGQLAQGSVARSGLLARIAAQEKELLASKQNFVAALAAKDADFARQKGIYQSTADDILTTPDGQKVLEIYLAGGPASYAAADRLLAQMQKDRSAQRQIDALNGDIADARTRAVFANDALAHGRASVGDTISRYVELVTLAPSSSEDWLKLAYLYWQAGDAAKVDGAALALQKFARTPTDRGGVAYWQGQASLLRGDVAAARVHFADNLKIAREVAAANPDNPDTQHNVVSCLDRVAVLAVRANDTVAAMGIYEEMLALALARANAARIPHKDGIEIDMLAPILNMGDVLAARKDFAGASASFGEGLSIAEALARTDPELILYQREVLVAQMRLSNVRLAQNDKAGAIDLIERALRTSETLVRLSPDLAQAQRDKLNLLVSLANMSASPHRWTDAQQQIDVMRVKGMILPGDATAVANIAAQSAKDKGTARAPAQ